MPTRKQLNLQLLLLWGVVKNKEICDKICQFLVKYYKIKQNVYTQYHKRTCTAANQNSLFLWTNAPFFLTVPSWNKSFAIRTNRFSIRITCIQTGCWATDNCWFVCCLLYYLKAWMVWLEKRSISCMCSLVVRSIVFIF